MSRLKEEKKRTPERIKEAEEAQKKYKEGEEASAGKTYQIPVRKTEGGRYGPDPQQMLRGLGLKRDLEVDKQLKEYDE